jgi:hypothetical protein
MSLLDTETVLREEVKAIHGKDLKDQTGQALYQELNALNQAALCLSGGGIRSASFGLGVIQALAAQRCGGNKGEPTNSENSLLAGFHYLSTVSGGGYIGSWFSAWVTRAGFSDVWSDLVGRPKGPDVEPPAIAWLRSYGNYLTPQLGFVSADFWGGIAIVLRNLLLNWLVVLPVLCLALLALKGFAIAVAWFSQFDPQNCEPWFFGALAAGCASLVVALWFATRNRPTRGSSDAGQGAFLLCDLVPAWLSAIFFTFALASPCAYTYLYQNPLPLFAMDGRCILLLGVAAGAILYGVAWALALPKFRGWKDYAGDIMAWLIGGAVYGALMAIGCYLYVRAFNDGIWLFSPGEVLLIVFGVPWALGSQLIGEMIFVALSSYETDSDSDREWLGRAAGWYLLVILPWPILMFLVFVAGPVVSDVYKDVRVWAAGLGTGGLIAWLGKSGLTSAKGAITDLKELSANVILAIAASVFGVILIVITSSALDHLLFGDALIRTMGFKAPVAPDGFPAWPGGWWLLIGIAIAVVVGAVGSHFVNINRFSLHAMYRNRLIRAFLGASRGEERKPNAFTDFDSHDNPHMDELALPHDTRQKPVLAKPGWKPFHVVNIALNIVSTRRLAWQERKAESFTVTPLHSGAPAGRPICEGAGVVRPRGAYRPSGGYGGGISLGTALAISGAAASPNMGYHSSPALAFLMTLFNVRLGWWLGNPASPHESIWKGEGPRMAIVALLNEMFGQTTDDGPYVYLSDGGHFENLGLYEMVRRRCRFIVVSDAGCDKDFQFEDLGNAVRKIYIDLGIGIYFRGLSELRNRALEDKAYAPGEPPFFAVGTIDYGSADGDASKPGTILYIKPCFHRNRIANVGVRNYAAAQPDFPHESTADQFFSESQLESYRALGFEMAESVLKQGLSGLEVGPETTFDDIFARFKTVDVP